MKIEHKVTYWDPCEQPTGGVGSPEGLEVRLNQLGEEGWSTVAVAASADGGYLVVLTRPSQADADVIQLVQLAAVYSVRQTIRRLVERAREALRPAPSAISTDTSPCRAKPDLAADLRGSGGVGSSPHTSPLTS